MHYRMPENAGKQFRGTHLGLDLVVAAWSGDDDRRIVRNSLVKGVVRSGVAGVESDQNVDIARFEIDDTRWSEFESVGPTRPGDLVAEFDKIGPRFYPSHPEGRPNAFAIARGFDEIFMGRKRKVAFA